MKYKLMLNAFVILILTAPALMWGSVNRDTGGDGSKSHPSRMPQRLQQETSTASFDGNEWFVLVRNDGQWARYMEGGDISGGVWPRASGNNTIFSSGLWIGAEVNDEVRVSAVHYGSSFSAGPIHEGGIPADPSDPAFRVYKINRWDSTAADWSEWPDSLGAPVDTSGDPYIPIDQTLFAVYNDLPANEVFGSAPLSAEVRQTIHGGITVETSGLNQTFYVTYQIINRGSDTWGAPRFSIWSDPDLGDYNDDLVAFDRDTDLARATPAT